MRRPAGTLPLGRILMLKSWAVVVIVVGTMAGLAQAGSRSGAPVQIFATSAWGGLGSARNSGDPNQAIGCTVTSYANGSPTVYCSAWSSTNANASCSSTNASLVAAAQHLPSDGRLYFSFDPSTAVCQAIQITTSSMFEPKQP
jgi:hypothetical protein